jgi:Family of unknown function (DUF6335)
MAKKAKRRTSAGRAASRRKPSVPARSARSKAGKKARMQRTSTGPTRAAKRATKKPAKASGKPSRPKRAASKRAAVRPAKSSRPMKTTAKRVGAARSTSTSVAPSSASRPMARPLHTLSLDRNRRHLPEIEDNVPTPPSSLDLDRTPSAARSGRQGMREARLQHNETSPELTGGDVDASWQDAYSTGDEAPGGDNPTPDQDRVDDIGKALGVQYEDSEELKAADKISERDRHRWELDPASAEDYPEHED